MSQNHSEKNISETTKSVVISILFSSLGLGLLGAATFAIKAYSNPLPLMLFGVVSGFIGGVLANFSKIKEIREFRSSANNHRSSVGQIIS